MSQRYQLLLTEQEEAALSLAAAEERAWAELTRKDVPSACEPLAQRLRQALEEECGFCVLSGLPFHAEEERARRLTFLIGYLLGTPLFQDAVGARMVDIRSTEAKAADAALYTPKKDGTHFRPYETRAPFRLHADPCDVAGLFCVQAAALGGASSIVNALTVHDRIAQSRPDLLEVLYQPFFYAKPKKAGEPVSYHAIPVFSWHEGYFKSHIVPDLIMVSQWVPEVPRLTRLQREALDELMRVADSEELKLELRLAPGQLLLLNNHVVWHGRSAYEDAPDATRHLLRLWVAARDSRPLHPVHEAWFGNPAAGALRGGYLRERLSELA